MGIIKAGARKPRPAGHLLIFCASPTRHGLHDLGLFAGTGVLDKVPDVDDRRERRRLQDHDGRDHGEPRPDEEGHAPLYPVSAHTTLETGVEPRDRDAGIPGVGIRAVVVMARISVVTVTPTTSVVETAMITAVVTTTTTRS